MSAIITEKFRHHNASQFVESFTEASASTYYLLDETNGNNMDLEGGTSML